MKSSPSPSSIFPARRALFASAMVVLLGTATAVAQTSGSSGTSGSSTGSSSSDTTRRNPSSSTSGSTGSYDTGSSRDSSTPSSTSPSSSTRSGTTGTTGTSSSRDTSGTSSTSTTSASSEKLSWGDRRFVTKAADGGQAEHDLAQLAAQRASSTEVRNYAKKLTDEHSKVNSELMSLASQKGVKVDTDDDKDRAYKRLEKKSGSEFDQEFVEHMIEEHEDDIKMFEKAASDAKDPEVRSFASKHVSSLREHLEEAQNLRQTLMPTGRTDASSGRSTTSGTTGTSSPDSTSPGSTGTQRGGSTGTQRDSSTGSSTGTSGTTGSSTSDRSTTPPRD